MWKLLGLAGCTMALAAGASAQKVVSLTLDRSVVIAGGSVTATITLDQKVPAGSTLKVQMQEPLVAPWTVTMPAGALAATVNVPTKGGTTSIETRIITASAGLSSASAPLLVFPNPTPRGFLPGTYFGGAFSSVGLPGQPTPGAYLEMVCLPNGSVELYCYGLSTTMHSASASLKYATGTDGTTQFSSLPFFEGALDGAGNLFAGHKAAYAATPPVLSTTPNYQDGQLDIPLWGGTVTFDGAGNATLNLTRRNVHFQVGTWGLSETLLPATKVGSYKLKRLQP